MAVRIASMSLRAVWVITLVLGLLFWFGIGTGLVAIHMLLGLLIVALVWFLGLAQATRPNGSAGLIFGTFLYGLLVAGLGLTQQQLLPGGAHWVIQVVHLLLGLGAIGLGEACASRYRRSTSTAAAA